MSEKDAHLSASSTSKKEGTGNIEAKEFAAFHLSSVRVGPIWKIGYIKTLFLARLKVSTQVAP
jgi:hypothetical protein